MNVAVVFWSGSGNTEVMAEPVAQGARSAGAEFDLLKPVQFKSETINSYDAFAFGCPAMGDEVLEEDKFDPMFTAVESDLEGKKAALFGSYGWGDGLWMRNWEDRAREDGINLVHASVIANEYPSDEDLNECKDLGRSLVG